MFTSCLITCVLFHQSPARIIVHHACSLLYITYYLFACSCVPMLTTGFSMHAYDSDYQYTCSDSSSNTADRVRE